LDESALRVPPHSAEAEAALLGCLLLDGTGDLMTRVAPVISADDFYAGANHTIYLAMVSLYARGQPVDAVTVVTELENKGVLGGAGGKPYLASLVGAVVGTSNCLTYAEIVRDKADLRWMGQALSDALQRVYEGANRAEVASLLEPVLLADVATTRPEPAGRLAQEAFLSAANDCVKTGWEALDSMTGGLVKGELTLLAGRPSMGKSTVAMCLCMNVAKAGGRVGVLSIETKRAQFVRNMAANHYGLPTDRLRPGSPDAKAVAEHMPTEEWAHRIIIDDRSSPSIFDVRASVRTMAYQAKIDVLIVDYLQLVLGDPTRQAERRELEVGSISRSLKAIAKEMNIAVLALSQLNRNVEQREGNRPRLSDLRESGSLEQDSDTVMLIHRKGYYDPNLTPEHRNDAELILAKQRNGPTGVVHLVADLPRLRFEPRSAY
jgi:replicative DNA helicase